MISVIALVFRYLKDKMEIQLIHKNVHVLVSVGFRSKTINTSDVGR